MCQLTLLSGKPCIANIPLFFNQTDYGDHLAVMLGSAAAQSIMYMLYDCNPLSSLLVSCI
jgi:hypothetical protein